MRYADFKIVVMCRQKEKGTAHTSAHSLHISHASTPTHVHPPRSPMSSMQGGDEAQFKELQEAYEVLSDPDKRRVRVCEGVCLAVCVGGWSVWWVGVCLSMYVWVWVCKGKTTGLVGEWAGVVSRV